VSCQELAALLAEHLSDDDSTKDEEYISYSPRVSPQRGLILFLRTEALLPISTILIC